jgi:hypothetical protein
MSENKITYPVTLPDLPTQCPEDGQPLVGPGGLAGIETDEMRLRTCSRCGAFYSSHAGADIVSGARIWSVYKHA